MHVQDVKYFDQDVLDNHLVHLTKQSNAECLNCITCSLNFLALILLLCLQIKDSRDESGSGRFSGVFSSSGSPRLGFSRSSSRLSMQDDTDDADFPFAVDDVDPDSRPGYVSAPTSYFPDHYVLMCKLIFFLAYAMCFLSNMGCLYMSNDHTAWEPLQST